MPNVEQTSIAYNEMLMDWDLIHDLLGGTRAMRNAGKKWLPQESREETLAYDNRLLRSFLYNGYRDTLRRLSSKPFSKTVTVKDMPDRLEAIEENVDKSGTNITQFSKEVFKSAVNYGLTHILVDFAKTDGDLNIQEENDTRPTWILVEPPRLIAWASELTDTGAHVLTEIRILEDSVERVDGYNEETVQYVRVFTQTTWQLWKKSDKEFVLHDEGEHTFGAVPLVTVYFNKKGFMIGEPALLDLAWMNLAHWQSSSDQRNILRFARVGIVFAKGFKEDEVSNIAIGPNQLIHSSSPNADMKYVEHSGKAIGAGEADLKAIEERMEVLGMQPMIARTAQSTATGKIIDESRTQSDIQAWIRAVERGIKTAIEFSAKWIDIESSAIVDIFQDFGIAQLSNTDIADLSKMRERRDISHETFIAEVKRRGMLSDDVTVENELERLTNEDKVFLDVDE